MKVLVVIAASTLLSACGSEPAETTENTSMGTAQASAADGSAEPRSSTGKGPAPSGRNVITSPVIAYGVAHYPNGRRVGVSQDFSLEKGKNPMWYQYETSDEPAQVLTFYKAEAEKAGFIVTTEKTREIWREISLKSSRPGGGVMNVNTLGKKGEDLLVNVHISEDS